MTVITFRPSNQALRRHPHAASGSRSRDHTLVPRALLDTDHRHVREERSRSRERGGSHRRIEHARQDAKGVEQEEERARCLAGGDVRRRRVISVIGCRARAARRYARRRTSRPSCAAVRTRRAGTRSARSRSGSHPRPMRLSPHRVAATVSTVFASW